MKYSQLKEIIKKKASKTEFAIVTNLENGLSEIYEPKKSLSKDFDIHKDQIDNFIEEESKRYKDPDQYKKWIEGQPQQLEQFRMIILEEQLVEKLKNALKSKKKVIKFSELANK